MIAKRYGKIRVPYFAPVFGFRHHLPQFGMVPLETGFELGGNILPDGCEHGFFFAEMDFQLGEMGLKLVPVFLFRRTQQAHAQGKRMVMLARKSNKCRMSFQRFHDFELQ